MSHIRYRHYGTVRKRTYEHPSCPDCGEPINPPRGPTGRPYAKCLDCTRRPSINDRGKWIRYNRRKREIRGLGL